MADKKAKGKAQAASPAKSIGFSTKSAPKRAAAAAEPKNKSNKAKAIALIALTLVIAITAGIVIGVLIINKNKPAPSIDYMKDDLSKYITISKEDYSGYTIDIPLDKLTDELVMNEINSLLTSKKVLNKDFGGGFMKSVALSLGDEAYIYFRGYTVDENGREHDFAGSSNFDEEDPSILEVGTGNLISDGEVSGQFIPGFGEALVGIVPINYAPFEIIREGTVGAGDVIYLSYTVIGENGNKTVSSERIDLALPYINEQYGEGFVEFFVGKSIGSDISDKLICEAGEGKTDTVYSAMKIEYVTRCESDPATITVKFPANYAKEELRGVEAKFDIYVKYAIIYDTPEFDDKFITETLKVKESELKDYQGSTLAEKYRAKISAELSKEIEESNHNLLLDKVWDRLTAKVKVIELPQAEIDAFYNSYYNEINSAYNQYINTYGQSSATLDAFAPSYISYTYGKTLGNDETWKDYITEMAKSDVKQKLTFYYIIRQENLIPSDAEYKEISERLYNELFEELKEKNAYQFEGLEGKEYDEKIAELKQFIDDNYGEEYLKERTYYYYGSRKLVELANVVRD